MVIADCGLGLRRGRIFVACSGNRSVTVTGGLHRCSYICFVMSLFPFCLAFSTFLSWCASRWPFCPIFVSTLSQLRPNFVTTLPERYTYIYIYIHIYVYIYSLIVLALSPAGTRSIRTLATRRRTRRRKGAPWCSTPRNEVGPFSSEFLI